MKGIGIQRPGVDDGLGSHGPRRRSAAHPLRRVTVAVVVLLALPFAGALHAQGPTHLQSSAHDIARAWARGADQVVAAQLVSDRVTLHLEGGVSSTLPTRQATAALRTYLRGHDPGEVQVARVALVEGSSERGFIELRWKVRRVGTSQTLQRTVFLGLRQDARGWAVDEVRILP